jgi:hypothetical protein
MTHFQSELTYHIPFSGKEKRSFGGRVFTLVWTGLYKGNAEAIAKNLSMDGDILVRVIKIKGGWAIYTKYTWRK